MKSSNETFGIIYRDTALLVEGMYCPEEPMVRYYSDGSGYPGAPAEFDVARIFVQGTKENIDITELLDDYQVEEIADILIDNITNGFY